MENQSDSDVGAPARRLRFDGTVTAGNIISIFLIVVAGFGFLNTTDKRVAVLEEARKVQSEKDLAQDAAIRDQLISFQRSIELVQKGVDRLNDRLDQREWQRTHP